MPLISNSQVESLMIQKNLMPNKIQKCIPRNIELYDTSDLNYRPILKSFTMLSID